MTKTSDAPVPFYLHALDEDAAKAIAGVVGTPFLTSGPVCRQVEDMLRAFFDVPHAKMTNSWTNGAVATLLALGIGAGDEVIVPAMTFVATANVVELVGATPIFVDVDPADLLMTPEAVTAALTERTRAVIPVHLYGQMVDVAALRAALPDGVAVIEDCAHCFEGTLRGERPGRHSDAAIFSFYATKNVTCGEGGAIVTRDDELAARLGPATLHGMSAGAADRFKGGRYAHWDMTALGTKANLPDLLASLLPPQIERVDERLARREALCFAYERLLRPMGVRLPAPVPEGRSARHLMAVYVGERRDEVMMELNAAGIGATVNYNAPTRTTYYAERYGIAPGTHPVAEAWGQGTLSLPLYPALESGAVERVCERIAEVLRKEPDAGTEAA